MPLMLVLSLHGLRVRQSLPEPHSALLDHHHRTMAQQRRIMLLSMMQQQLLVLKTTLFLIMCRLQQQQAELLWTSLSVQCREQLLPISSWTVLGRLLQFRSPRAVFWCSLAWLAWRFAVAAPNSVANNAKKPSVRATSLIIPSIELT